MQSFYLLLNNSFQLHYPTNCYYPNNLQIYLHTYYIINKSEVIIQWHNEYLILTARIAVRFCGAIFQLAFGLLQNRTLEAHMTVIMVENGVFPTGQSSNKQAAALRKIFKSIAPMYYMCKISGILPTSIKKRNEEMYIENTRRDLIYFLTYLFGYLSISVYTLINIRNDTNNFNIVPKVFVEAECMIIVILKLLTVICAFVFKKKIGNCLQLLAEVDVAFENSGVTVNYQAAYKKAMRLFFVIIVSVLCRSILVLTTVDIDFCQQVSLFVATIVKSLLKYEFIVFVLLLCGRYKTINSSIKSFYKKPVKFIPFEKVPKITEKLYILCRMHYKLCNISRNLNAAFAFQLLLSTGVSLYDILFQSYYLYICLSGRVSGVKMNMIMCAVTWLVDEIVEVYVLVSVCAETCECVRILGFL